MSSDNNDEVKFDNSDYEALSALLDFRSDRATAHASFFVACIFGLFTLLSLLDKADPFPMIIFSFTYVLLSLAGGYSLLNFNHFSNEAEKIREMIRSKPLLFEKMRKLKKKYCRYCGTEIRIDALFCEECGKKITEGSFLFFLKSYFYKIKYHEHKLTIMVVSYFVIVISPFLITILNWLFNFFWN